MSEREDEHFDIDDEFLGEAEEAHDFEPLIERTERRPSRRPANAAAAVKPVDRSRSYRHMVNPFEPLKVFSDDQVASIHNTALTILEEHGLRVLPADARQVYARGGAMVDESTLMVRMDRGMVAAALATAPREITLHAKDPERHQPIFGRHVVFAPTSGPPNIMDTKGGRRAGTFTDFCNLMKLCQNYEVIQVLGGGVEPQDVPVQFRHLETTRAMLTLTDKIPKFYSRGSPQIADNFELVRIAYGLSPEEFQARPYCCTVINTNSPRQLDIPMANGIMEFAAAGQVLIITPFTLAGAMRRASWTFRWPTASWNLPPPDRC